MSTKPFSVDTLEGGKVHIKYETGEEFTGDPLEVTQKIAEAHIKTEKWARGVKAENDTLKATPSAAKPPDAPPADPNEAQLQNYLIEQTAKGLGYANAEEYKRDLSRVKSVTSEVEDNLVATAFLAQCPDFPNTPEAIDALSKKIDQLGGQFRPIDMVAAHSLCVRDGSYKPLTSEEQNQGWEQRMTQANNQQRGTPPPPPSGSTPTTGAAETDPWKMSMDDLRKQILERNAKGERAFTPGSGDLNI